MYPNPYGNQQQQQGIGFTPPQQGNPPYPGQTPGYPPPYPQQGNSPYPPASGFPIPPGGVNSGYQAPQYPPSPFYQQAGATQQPPPYGGYPPQPTGSPGYPNQPSYPGAAPPAYQPIQQASVTPSYQLPGYPGQGNPAPAYPGQGNPAPAYPGQGNPAPGYPGQGNPALGYPGQGSSAPAYPAAVSGYQAPSYQAPPVHTQTMQQYQDTPTLREGPIDAAGDAQVLRKAMKGFGTDEAAIINVLGKRTSNQRQQIAQAFKASFGKDLVKDLKSELGGRLEEVVLALMTPRYDLLAKTVYKAMSGIGTKEKALVDVLCTGDNNDIRMINAAYQRLYGKTMEKELQGDTSGHFRRLLVSITTAGRSEDPVANPVMAIDDAQKLYQAGEKQWGTDESMFNMILATRSYAHLRLMFHEYERLTGHSFEKAVETEFSGDVETGMLALVKSAKSRAAYFAERVYESVAGMGTKDEDLVFIIVSRADVDLENIKQEYQRMYGRSLADAIAGDTSGDYKKILMALVGM